MPFKSSGQKQTCSRQQPRDRIHSPDGETMQSISTQMPSRLLSSTNAVTYRERKYGENYNKWHKKICFKTAISILLISNDNSFRVLFDKIASVYFIWKIYLYFSIGNGQPREPALCQLYRHTFVPYTSLQDYYSTPDRQTEYHNDRVYLSVCVLVLPRAYRWNYKFDLHQFIRPMHAAYVRSSWYSSGGVAIRYVLPVVQLTSCLHIMVSNRRQENGIYSVLKVTHQFIFRIPLKVSDE